MCIEGALGLDFAANSFYNTVLSAHSGKHWAYGLGVKTKININRFIGIFKDNFTFAKER